jgi:4-alpha-glucanotransferase
MALFEAAERQLGKLPLVAEDLGLITPDVDALRRQAGIPGMAVLQFAYDGNPANRYLSHNHTRDLVVYPGTHDNDTIPNWSADLPRQRRRYVEAYLPGVADDPAWTLIEEAWSSVACCAIVQLQDLLGLRGDGRMNQPCNPDGNWRWRYVRHRGDDRAFARLKELTRRYARLLLPLPTVGRG